MARKIKSSSAWLAAVAMMAGGVALGSDCSPLPGIVIVSAQQTDAEASGAMADARRTESVTLLVRGMMKSRSGAT